MNVTRALARGAAVLAVLTVFAVLAVPASAQHPGEATRTDTVTVSHRVLVAGDVTPAEAKRRAIENLLAEAVRRTVGVRVQAGQLAIAEDRAGRAAESFLSAVQLDAAGRATDYRVLDERFETLPNALLGPQIYYEVRAVVSVARETGAADPAFRVSLTLNDALFFARSGGVRSSDEVIATITPTRDAWITVLAIADDSVQVLLPNRFIAQPRVAGGRSYEFPPADWRARGLRVRATLPDGLAARQELIAVVATRSPVQFTDPLRGSAGSSRTALADGARTPVLALQRWLVSIPLGDRAMALAAYEVRRQCMPAPNGSCTSLDPRHHDAR